MKGPLKKFINRQDSILLLITIASAFALTGAYISEYIFGYQPCILCIYQRWPFFIVIALYLTSLILKKQIRPLAILATICICANIIIASYHVGLEQKIFKEFGGCSSIVDLNKIDNLAELTQAISKINAIKCDEPQFYFLKITMAGWNLIYCLIILNISFIIYRYKRHR